MHVQNHRCPNNLPLKSLMAISVFKNQETGLEFFIQLQNRQIDLHDDQVGFEVFDDPIKPCVVHIDFRDFHKAKLAWAYSSSSFSPGIRLAGWPARSQPFT